MTFFLSKPEQLPPFRKGEVTVLEAVYRCYLRAVAAMGQRALSTLTQKATHAEVDDVVAETFARAFTAEARKAYDGARPYRPYLLTIGRNVVRKLALSSRREITLPSDEALQGGDDPRFEDYADAAIVAATERYIDALDPASRKLHALRYEQSCGQEEAARALGISRQNLRTAEAKLRSGLRAHLEALRLIEPQPPSEST